MPNIPTVRHGKPQVEAQGPTTSELPQDVTADLAWIIVTHKRGLLLLWSDEGPTRDCIRIYCRSAMQTMYLGIVCLLSRKPVPYRRYGSTVLQTRGMAFKWCIVIATLALAAAQVRGRIAAFAVHLQPLLMSPRWLRPHVASGRGSVCEPVMTWLCFWDVNCVS